MHLEIGSMRQTTKNIGVRVNDQELLVLGHVPAENYPSAIRYLIKYWAEREQQVEQLQQIGDRIIAALTMKIELLGRQDYKPVDLAPLLAAIEAIKPSTEPSGHAADAIMRKGLADAIRHGLIPLAPMDRRGPLTGVVEMLEGRAR